MTQDKISKIIEMYKRGTPGEKDNAKRILDKLGVDVEALNKKKTIKERLRDFFTTEAVKTYSINFNNCLELYLIQLIYGLISNNTSLLGFDSNGDNCVKIKCTKSQAKMIVKIFKNHKKNFTSYIFGLGTTYFNNLMSNE